MHILIAAIASILVYSCKADVDVNESAKNIETNQQTDYLPYFYFPPMFYYPYNQQPKATVDEDKGSERFKPQKPFGGDKSDRWLYPPRRYYVHWADTEEQNNWDQWDKWGQWRGWYKRPASSTEPPQ